MNNKKRYKSCFNKCIKIRQKHYDWIVKVKDTKTLAGFLDKVINSYKKHEILQRGSL